MSVASAELSARYAASLGDYLSGKGEPALEAAYECGRAAMAEGRGVVELVRRHTDADAAGDETLARLIAADDET